MAGSVECVSDRPAINTSGESGREEPLQRRVDTLWLMIAFIVALPLLACFFSFQLTDSQWFRRVADPQWIQSSDRIYTAHDLPCQVVVYGDSTAITGVDANVIQRLTGLRTCNIAQTKGAIVVLGTSGLDMFLKHNPRPRYLVLQFSGADFYKPQSWLDTTSYMEGVVPLLRFYPKREFLAALIRHPEIFMGMMHYAYITGPLNWWSNRTRVASWNTDTQLVNVHFVRPEPPIQSCAEAVDIDPMFHKPDLSFIQHLRETYSGAADHLLINVAPLSACDDRFDYIARTLHGTNNSLERYPLYLYNEGYTHYTRQGAQRLSEELAAQIEAMKAEDSRKRDHELAANLIGAR